MDKDERIRARAMDRVHSMGQSKDKRGGVGVRTGLKANVRADNDVDMDNEGVYVDDKMDAGIGGNDADADGDGTLCWNDVMQVGRGLAHVPVQLAHMAIDGIKTTGQSNSLTAAGPLSLLLRLVARCINHPTPTSPVDDALASPGPLSGPLSEPQSLCVTSEQRTKLALLRKHGGEALLVKAFLAETSGGNGNDNGNGMCTENDMVSYLLFKSAELYHNFKSTATTVLKLLIDLICLP